MNRISAVLLALSLPSLALGQVRILSVAPSTVQPGSTLIATGNSFPAGVGAPNVTARFTPAVVGAGPTVDVALGALNSLAGSTMRATIVIPASLTLAAPTPYLVTLSGAVAPAFATAVAGNIVINPPPSLATVTPASGRLTQTLNVTVAGSYSNFFPGVSTVNFGPGITVNSVAVANATNLTANLTITGAASLGPANVRVTTGGEVLTLGNGFTVFAAPVVLSVGPSNATVGQTNLNVALIGSGTTWQTGPGVLAASFGPGITVNSILASSNTSATANISIDGAAVAGPRNITVNKGTETALGNGLFSVVSAPAITGIVPNSGRLTQTFPVVINTANLVIDGTTSVNFGAGITVNSTTPNSPGAGSVTVLITITGGAALGPRNVTVTTGAASATATSGFTVLPAPTILSVNPATGVVGQINLNIGLAGSGTTWQTGLGTLGANFGPGIIVNSISATSDTAATASISIDVGATLGLRTVTVTRGTETASFANAFTVQPAPTLLSIAPNTGQQGQSGINVTITGQNTAFTGGSVVNLGSGITVTNLAAPNATTLTGLLAIAGTAAVGLRTLTVDGVTLNAAFTVNPGTPVLLSIAPNAGQQGQTNLNVTITGQFTNFTNATAVNLSPDIAVSNIVATNATTLTATLAIGNNATPGARNLTVGGLTLNGAFAVNPGNAVLQSIAPNSGQQGQVVNITVLGQFTNFSNASSVDLGLGIAATNIAAPNATTLTATLTIAGTAATGPRTLTIDGFTLPGAFTVTPGTPVLLSIAPNAGQQGQTNLNVTIAGQFTNFTNATTVSLGPDIAISNIVATNATTLTATLAIGNNATPGARNLTVGGLTLNSAFAVNPGNAVLQSLAPNTGQQGQVVNITVIGQFTNFRATSAASLGAGITVGNIAAPDTNTLTATLTIAANAATGLRTLTVDGLTLANAFTVNPGTPALTSLAPSTGMQGQSGINVTIAGQFTSFSNASIVSLGTGVTITNVVASTATSLTATLAVANSAPLGPRSLTVDGLTLPNAFTVTSGQPVITSITPNSGTQGQSGINVTIAGQFTNFTNASVLDIGTGITVSNVIAVNATTLTATLAIANNAQIGLRSLSIDGLPFGSSFTVNSGAPVLLSISPNSGLQGQSNISVTIAGQFTSFTNASSVSLGAGITVTNIAATNATSLTATLAVANNAAAGLRTLTVDGLTLANAFTVTAATPVLLSITPNAGQQGQSAIGVTIAGQFTNFTNASSVSLGAGITVTNIAASNATSLTATLAIANNAAIGSRTLTVDGLTLASAFTVNPGTPLLLTIVPNTGQQGQAGINVTVTGQFTNFVAGTTLLNLGGNITVTNVSVTNATTLTATLAVLPAAATGPRNVVATTGAESATLTNGFTVTNGSPILLTVAPNGGAQGQTVSNVLLTGQFTNFVQGTTSVSLGAGVTISNVTVTSPSTVTVTALVAAAAVLGNRSATVTTGAESVTLPNAFTVSSAPTQVSGVLFSPGGVVPLPNAPVRLYTGNALTFFGSATTSGTGAFSFSSLPAGQFSVYAFDQSPNPTKFAYATGTAAAGSSVAQNLTLSGTSQVTVRVFTLLGAQAPNAVVGLTPNAVPVPADLASTLRTQQTAGANGQTVFASAFAGNFIADAADSNGQFSSIVFGTVASGGSVTIDITLNAPEAVSQVVAILNGAPYGDTLPTGQNEGVSSIVSLFNGLPAGNTLPAGQNEGVSAIVSLFNGLPAGNTLPAGQNEGVSAIVSLFNGIAPGNTLPSGFNEAVSSIVLAQVTNSGGAFRILNPALVSSTEADSASQDTRPLHHLVAGETVTVESEFPAPFYLNGRLAGNDAGQPNRLTFVVPDGPTGVALRAGSSAETLFNVAAPEAVRLSGQVLRATAAPANFAVRYAGLRAELFQLANPGDAPVLEHLTPVAELPVSSLNLHNPHQAFGLFPVTGVTKPNFAVRLSGEFLAETDGQYQFALSGAEGARLTIDGRPAESVTLTAGWKRLELIVWQTSGSAELVATYTPPTGVARQPIPAALLRATFTSVKTNEDGQFTIATPAWMATAIEGLAAGAEIRWAHKEIK